MRSVLFALVACLGLTQVAAAAYIEVVFRPQNGTPDVASEWAMEMISDTPIGSTGIYIVNADPSTGFTSWNVGGTPVLGLEGVQATIHAAEDPTAAWNTYDVWWFGLFPPLPYPGMAINAHPGFVAFALGPVNTWLGLGILHDVTQIGIMSGEGVETNLWADGAGTHISAHDVHYTFPEPAALPLLALGLAALALLRGQEI